MHGINRLKLLCHELATAATYGIQSRCLLYVVASFDHEVLIDFYYMECLYAYNSGHLLQRKGACMSSGYGDKYMEVISSSSGRPQPLTIAL